MAKKNIGSICPRCSLPLELCVCTKLEQEEQKIIITQDKRKWGRMMTVLTMSNYGDLDLDKLCTRAKRFCASGGTVKGDTIEIQGDHIPKLRKLLKKLGYNEENIEIRK